MSQHFWEKKGHLGVLALQFCFFSPRLFDGQFHIPPFFPALSITFSRADSFG